MRLSLERWPSSYGSSRGRWIVQGLPVALVQDFDGGWDFIGPGARPAVLFGDRFEFEEDGAGLSFEELKSFCPSLSESYRTRADALAALEGDLTAGLPSVLGEIL